MFWPYLPCPSCPKLSSDNIQKLFEFCDIRKLTRRPAKTAIFFARIEKIWSTYINSYKRDDSLKSKFRRFSTNIKSTTDFYILCKRFRSKFFVSVPKKFRWGTLRYLTNFRVSKNFLHEGVSTIFCRLFNISQYRNLRWGTIHCFINFGYQKVLCTRWVYHDFLSKFFCLTVPKNFIGGLFCISENSWYRKSLSIGGLEGGGVTIRNRETIWHDRD